MKRSYLWLIVITCFTLLIIGFPFLVFAADHRNLEENHPTRIEDAYPISFRSFEFQTRIGYESETDVGKDTGVFEGELKWGFLKNAHLVLGLPINFGSNLEPDLNGDVRFESLYNFNVETLTLPAFAFKVDFLLPFGNDSQGIDLDLVAIATKGIGQSRFHFNGIYRVNGGRGPGERRHLYVFGIAFDHPIDLDHLFTADFFVEQAERKGQEPFYSFVIGMRKQVNPWSVLTMGVGHAFGNDRAADFIATLGFQVNF